LHPVRILDEDDGPAKQPRQVQMRVLEAADTG
jgi:hypothetical protein